MKHTIMNSAKPSLGEVNQAAAQAEAIEVRIAASQKRLSAVLNEEDQLREEIQAADKELRDLRYYYSLK